MSHRRCDSGEGSRPNDRPEPLTPTLSHKGRENFFDRRLSCSISMSYRTIKCRIYSRLHIGSKIRTIESKADAGIVDSGKLTPGRDDRLCPRIRYRSVRLWQEHHQPRCQGSAPYSRSLCGQARAARLIDCQCADRSASPWFAAASGCRKGAGPTQCWQSTRRRDGRTVSLSCSVPGHAGQ